MGAYLYHEAWNHPYYIGNALVIQRGWYEPCLPVVHRHKFNEEQGSGKVGMCRQGMWLTFRNHRGVELPVFTTRQWDFFFFWRNTSTEQVNVIQLAAHHSLSQMKRSGGKGGLIYLRRSMSLRNVTARQGLLRGSWACDTQTNSFNPPRRRNVHSSRRKASSVIPSRNINICSWTSLKL